VNLRLSNTCVLPGVQPAAQSESRWGSMKQDLTRASQHHALVRMMSKQIFSAVVHVPFHILCIPCLRGDASSLCCSRIFILLTLRHSRHPCQACYVAATRAHSICCPMIFVTRDASWHLSHANTHAESPVQLSRELLKQANSTVQKS
jgi:hypothetical protein